jgi:hypothetical protein
LAIEKMKEQLVLAGQEFAGHKPKKPCSASPSAATTRLFF